METASEMKRSSSVVTQDAQDALTPQQVLDDLKRGNERFVADSLTQRDYLAQARATAQGQFPKAIVLGCLDSRVPPEIVFDQGIGDLFVGRVAGNIVNDDLLGSMEFGTQLAGSKLIVVLGHTSCGAVKGAADGAELGNLTGLLDKLRPALEQAQAQTEGEYNSGNDPYVKAAIEENVRLTVADIKAKSPVLSARVSSGDLMVVGGVYNLGTGRVDWLDS